MGDSKLFRKLFAKIGKKTQQRNQRQTNKPNTRTKMEITKQWNQLSKRSANLFIRKAERNKFPDLGLQMVSANYRALVRQLLWSCFKKQGMAVESGKIWENMVEDRFFSFGFIFPSPFFAFIYLLNTHILVQVHYTIL